MEYISYQKKSKSIYYLYLLLMSFFLTGCIDLATNESKHKMSHVKKTIHNKGQVYVMRGG